MFPPEKTNKVINHFTVSRERLNFHSMGGSYLFSTGSLSDGSVNHECDCFNNDYDYINWHSVRVTGVSTWMEAE